VTITYKCIDLELKNMHIDNDEPQKERDND